MRLSQTDMGNLLLGAGAIGVMACTGVKLLLGLQVSSLSIGSLLWWSALLIAGGLLWMAIGKLTC